MRMSQYSSDSVNPTSKNADLISNIYKKKPRQPNWLKNMSYSKQKEHIPDKKNTSVFEEESCVSLVAPNDPWGRP